MLLKKKKTSKFITDDIEISSDDSDSEKSDEKNSNEKIKCLIFFRKYKKFLFFRLCKFSPEI